MLFDHKIEMLNTAKSLNSDLKFVLFINLLTNNFLI